MTMELASYLQLLRRWLWLIVLAAVLAGGVALLVARSQPPVFQATATIQVGAFQDLPNPDARLIASAQGLAQSYFVLAKTRPFLEAAIQRASLPFDPDALAKTFEMTIVPSTPFFTITATADSPTTAAQIVNAIADELVARTAQADQARQQQISSLQTQINDVTAQLEKDRAELALIEQRLNNPGNQDNILVLRQNELIARVNQQQATLAEFQNSLITLQSQVTLNVFTLIEPARVPLQPLGGSVVRDALLAALLGAALSIGLIALLEQLNTTIKSTSEVTPLLKVPLLGALPAYGRKGTYKKRLIAWQDPRSPASEAFRALRVNLMFMEKNAEGQHAHTFVVTSSRPGEGKSVTAANIAITFSQLGQKVVLIDADLRHPSQHLLFGLPNTAGLADILGSEPSTAPEVVLQTAQVGNEKQEAFYGNLRETQETASLARSGQAHQPFYTFDDDLPILQSAVPHLQVITAGTPLNNSADILGSPRLRDLVQHLLTHRGFEVVIFDTPPILEVSDSGVVAGVVEAPVLLVVEANQTRRNHAAAAIQRFAMLSVPVIGVILNRVRAANEQSGYFTSGGYGQTPEKPMS